jgi:hypothetical protein
MSAAAVFAGLLLATCMSANYVIRPKLPDCGS